MKAIIHTKYGGPDVLQLTEVEKPAPKDNEVLVKIKAAALNAYDWRMMRADPFLVRLMAGFFKPDNQFLGADFSGQVEAVGSSVTQFKISDEVYGTYSKKGSGAFAEYISVPEKLISFKPKSVSFEEAAALPMATLTALQGLRDHGNIQAGHKVLIVGASGGVGTYAIQVAKVFDTEVTAVCSTRNIELAKSLGADHAIDYTKEDIIKKGESYDLILSVNGNQSMFDFKRIMARNSSLVIAGGSMKLLIQLMIFGKILFLSKGRKFHTFVAKLSQEQLKYIAELVDAGIVKSVIDKQFTLDKTADAIRYIEEGHARGKIVITVS